MGEGEERRGPGDGERKRQRGGPSAHPPPLSGAFWWRKRGRPRRAGPSQALDPPGRLPGPSPRTLGAWMSSPCPGSLPRELRASRAPRWPPGHKVKVQEFQILCKVIPHVGGGGRAESRHFVQLCRDPPTPISGPWWGGTLLVVGGGLGLAQRPPLLPPLLQSTGGLRPPTQLCGRVMVATRSVPGPHTAGS